MPCRLLAALLLLAAAVLAPAVETSPLAVLSVSDGDTITVRGDLGGVALPVKVRLLYLDTPESRDNGHGAGMAEGKQAGEALRAAVPVGSEVVLWGPGEQLKPDTYGRILAVVYPLEDGQRASINAEMIRPAGRPTGVSTGTRRSWCMQSCSRRRLLPKRRRPGRGPPRRSTCTTRETSGRPRRGRRRKRHERPSGALGPHHCWISFWVISVPPDWAGLAGAI